MSHDNDISWIIKLELEYYIFAQGSAGGTNQFMCGHEAGEVTFPGQMKVLTKKNSGADELSLKAMRCCGVLVPYHAIVF